MAVGTGSADADTDAGTTGTDSTSAEGVFSTLDVQWSRPHVWYNRVEGPHVGGEWTVSTGWGVSVTLRGGHSFFLHDAARWSYGGTLASELPTTVLNRVAINYRYGVDPRYEADARLFAPLTRGINTVWTLLGEADYYDYYGNERLRAGLFATLPVTDAQVRLQYRAERHVSLTDVSHYTVLGRSPVFGRRMRQPSNPPINEGRLRSLDVRLAWGDDPHPRGIFPITRVEMEVEYAGEWLGSDLTFTRGEIAVDTRVETFFRRRMLPNTLDLRAVTGGALGSLPVQRFGVVEASPLLYTPFGALRTLDDRPYQGTANAALFWEHNFRTIPFELLGFYGAADRHVELILHGAHARTWLDGDRRLRLRRRGTVLRESGGIHHELGLSVNGLLKDLIRIDVTARLDQRTYSIGVSLLRFL